MRPKHLLLHKSALTYTDLEPESDEAHAEWKLTEAEHIATWMEPSDTSPGVNVLFFVFCDPARPARCSFGACRWSGTWARRSGSAEEKR